jgi:sigma-B regulation protein RsbU (phosphoserine phosphatase)
MRWRFGEPEGLAIGAALLSGALIAAIDLLAPGANFSSLFLLIPIIASTAADPRRTALLGSLAVVLGVLFLSLDGAGATEVVVRVLGLLLGSVVAVALSVNRSRRERRLRDLDQFANIAQALIIRPIPARLANIGAAGRYLSASKVVAVGGDLYDVALTPGGVRFVIGDACGKGLGGVRLAASVLTRFREAVFLEPDLGSLARELDAHVVDVCRREGRELDFVTAVLGELTDDGELAIVSCGHPDGVVIRRSGPAPLCPADRAYPLGLGCTPIVERFHLEVGERVVWWTDGAAEARDHSGTFFDVEGTVAGAIADRSLADALDAVVAAVQAHAAGDVRDDVALLAFERMVPAPAGTWPGAASVLP